MADHSFNASNQPNTCLWCGKKLNYTWNFDKVQVGTRIRRRKFYSYATDEYEIAESVEPKYKFANRRKRYSKPGYLGNGYFCTITCAEQFAFAAVHNGYRFQPKS